MKRKVPAMVAPLIAARLSATNQVKRAIVGQAMRKVAGDGIRKLTAMRAALPQHRSKRR